MTEQIITQNETPAVTSGPRRRRLLEFDFARGFAILFVVLIHWDPAEAPVWWQHAVSYIHTFIMPLFLAVSGFVYMHTRGTRSYGAFLLGKVKRLLVPYFFTSLIVVTIKLLMQGEAYVQHPVTTATYLEIFYLPAAGYYLWFVWALWWMFMIVPFFKTPKMRLVLLAISFVAAYLPVTAPDVFCLEMTRRMTVFFVLGTVLYDYRDVVGFSSSRPDGRQAPVPACIATVLFILSSVFYFTVLPQAAYANPYFAIYAVPALCGFLVPHATSRFGRTMLQISAASYLIYLFHTTFLGFAKSLVLPWIDGRTFPLVDGHAQVWPFLAATAITLTVGATVPFLLYRYVLNRFRVTRFMFGLK